jgi:hypothetical protein
MQEVELNQVSYPQVINSAEHGKGSKTNTQTK